MTACAQGQVARTPASRLVVVPCMKSLPNSLVWSVSIPCSHHGTDTDLMTQGDKVKKVVVVPGTQCIVVFPGAPNKLKECAHGDKEERCRPLNVGQTSKQQPISTKGLGQSWFGKCFWPDHQDHTEPIEQRTLICNKGGSTFANDWDESRHWIRAGNAHWKDRGQPGWKDHGPFGN